MASLAKQQQWLFWLEATKAGESSRKCFPCLGFAKMYGNLHQKYVFKCSGIDIYRLHIKRE